MTPLLRQLDRLDRKQGPPAEAAASPRHPRGRLLQVARATSRPWSAHDTPGHHDPQTKNSARTGCRRPGA